MNSNFLKLNPSDFVRGLVVAVIVVVLGALTEAVKLNDLNFASYDWVSIADVAIKAAVAYLAKNFLTDSSGKVLGKIG